MNHDKPRLRHETAEFRPASTGDGRKWLTVYNPGFFLVFLGLFNPLLWASLHAGAELGIILMNGLYTVLLAAFVITVMLIGHRRLTKDLSGDD